MEKVQYYLAFPAEPRRRVDNQFVLDEFHIQNFIKFLFLDIQRNLMNFDELDSHLRINFEWMKVEIWVNTEEIILEKIGVGQFQMTPVDVFRQQQFQFWKADFPRQDLSSIIGI